jgi:glycosyltransferase involved in cell wall biosynthesis
MVVIPNGFDTGVHAPSARARQAVRRELGIPSDARVIALVARVDPQKDHPNFFSAAGELSRLGVDAHFLLAGDGTGPENGELRELARRAGVKDTTHFLGRRSDVADLLAASDLATLSSAYGESFPLVLGEAMACGVPCVATDLGDCRALVGRTGEIVPPRDSVALAAAWHRLLSAPEGVRAQRGRAARQRVLSHFELSLVARQYRRIWSVAARGGPVQASGLRTIR